MKFLHGSAGYQSVWIAIPFVCLFVWLFNSYRLGKFRSFLKVRLGKVFWASAGIILIFVLTMFLMTPRVFSMREIDVSEIDGYPELSQELAIYQQEYNEIHPGSKFYQITVGNYFSQDTTLILPCYEAVFRTAPRHGEASWSSKITVVTAGTEIDDVCLKDLSVEIQVGDETFVSSKAETDPGIYSVGDDFYRYCAPELDVEPRVKYGVNWIIGTTPSATEENLLVTGGFLWNYRLFVYGKEIDTVTDELIVGEYIVNAT